MFLMVNEFIITNIKNKILLDTSLNKSDWYEIINCFDDFLNEQYKKKYSIDITKNVKQYIDWCFSEYTDKCFILSNENFIEYKLHLENIKKYKESTVLYKTVALHKLSNFFIKLTLENSKNKLSDHSRKIKSHYNYLTKMYIMM